MWVPHRRPPRSPSCRRPPPRPRYCPSVGRATSHRRDPGEHEPARRSPSGGQQQCRRTRRSQLSQRGCGLALGDRSKRFLCFLHSRSFGRIRSQHPVQYPGERAGLPDGLISPRATRCRSAYGFSSPSNGGLPSTAAYSIAPSEKTSDANTASAPPATSGARNAGVPAMTSPRSRCPHQPHERCRNRQASPFRRARSGHCSASRRGARSPRRAQRRGRKPPRPRCAPRTAVSARRAGGQRGQALRRQ